MKVALLTICYCVIGSTAIQPSFLARRDYGSGVPGEDVSGYVAVADINGDGIPDIVAVNGYTIYTLLGVGNGTFQVGPSTEPGLDLAVDDVIPIDLNGDGKIDLVLSANGSIGICFGNGDGTFQQAVLYGAPVPASGPVVGDFNGDGI